MLQAEDGIGGVISGLEFRRLLFRSDKVEQRGAVGKLEVKQKGIYQWELSRMVRALSLPQ